MIIRSVDATWLSVPIPLERQHVSDFGRIASFDMALVRIETDDGLVGWGESKAAVGSAGSCSVLVSCIEDEFRPMLVGEDPRQITKLWERMYNGSRSGYALERGRTFPALGRRGLNIAAISGVDMALWDLLGQSLGAPVVELWGGACRADMPVYASGGWADADGIGAELQGYVDRGFAAVKMRVGVMDGDVETSVARVGAARAALGPHIGLMVDAHGTFSSAEAKRFAAGVEAFGLRWFEEPVSADDRRGARAVRASTTIAIAAGESEFTRFDFRDLIELEAVDVLQPDLAICGGPTEGRRIATLAETYQLELAPHCWGSALSFSCGTSLAFATPSATVIEYSLGANPLLHELAGATIEVSDGRIQARTATWSRCDAERGLRRRTHTNTRTRRREMMTTGNRIHHVNLMVDDLAAATEFYRDGLGLRALPTPDLGFPAQFLEINEHQEIHLNELRDITPERAHFCLRVADFNLTFQRMRDRGAIETATWGRAKRLPSGVMQMFVRDPAGNLIELSCEAEDDVDPTIFETEFFEGT